MPAAVLDVLIIGAGPVGCTLALRAAGRSVALLERRPQGGTPAAEPHTPQPDARRAFRPIALSHASRLILERQDAWPGSMVSPIETIQVTQAGGIGRAELCAADAGVPALGYVLGYTAITRALGDRLAASGAQLLDGTHLDSLEATPQCVIARFERLGAPQTLAARCVVHAEGSATSAREKRYEFDALTAQVEVKPAAASTAFERFTDEGPLALLPMAGRYALVWSARPQRAGALAQAAPEAFLAELTRVIGARAGRFVSVGAREVQPLVLRVRGSRIGAREAFIGNAAQTLHPVAGQGLNLGLRDAWDLAAAMHGAPDPGAPATLARFAASRRFDAGATIGITELLAGAFLCGNPALRAARGVALIALDVLPPLRRFFARRMIFGPSAIP
jgi:2-octaprenyl-6-methoxyphenol hydroxylase